MAGPDHEPSAPSPESLAEPSLGDLLGRAERALTAFLDGLEDAPADARGEHDPERWRRPPGRAPTGLATLLDTMHGATASAVETAGPRYFAYIPGGGLPSSAVGELYARVVNRYTALADLAPGLVALEDGVLRWLAGVFGLPAGANGLITTGGSQAVLTAVLAARERHLEPHQLTEARLYVSDQAHQSMAKAARTAGFPRSAVRVLATRDGRRLDPGDVRAAIVEDRAAGLRPVLVMGTAGTTNAGAVDPLDALADVAAEEGLWYHVDACYGGFFVLTDRGASALGGIERADSVALDPHKSLFLPYGTGVLLVRDPTTLVAAAGDDAGEYLDDIRGGALPDYAHLSTELTREHRGLRLWLPLHLHGTDAFRAALDEKLDLARHVHEVLARHQALEVPERPELSTVVVRAAAGDDATRRLHQRVHASGRVFCSSTRLDGRLTLRLCVLSLRTRRPHIDEALAVVTAAADEGEHHDTTPHVPTT